MIHDDWVGRWKSIYRKIGWFLEYSEWIAGKFFLFLKTGLESRCSLGVWNEYHGMDHHTVRRSGWADLQQSKLDTKKKKKVRDIRVMAITPIAIAMCCPPCLKLCLHPEVSGVKTNNHHFRMIPGESRTNQEFAVICWFPRSIMEMITWPIDNDTKANQAVLKGESFVIKDQQDSHQIPKMITVIHIRRSWSGKEYKRKLL